MLETSQEAKPSEMTAKSKAEATARMYELASEPIEPLGPGSKEKRSALEALGRAAGLDLTGVRTKVACGADIAARLDIAWDAACFSAGDTITLVGMNRLLEAFDTQFPGVALAKAPVNGFDAPTDDSKEYDMYEDVDDAEVQEDLRAAIAEALAEQLALLSAHIETPNGFDAPPEGEFEPGEIDFATYDWLERVVSVQGWLRFETKLSGSSTIKLQELTSNLGYPSPVDCVEATTGQLTDEALDRLKAIAEQAVEFADRFQAALEQDGGTRTAATGTWAELWDEAVGDEVVHPVSIAAKTDIWSITDFVVKAKNGKLNLVPSYQRSDVWPVKDRQLLIISILRGIPLPAVILTKPQAPGLPYEVVDGKQRLTSILRFTGQHPVALAKVREFQADNKSDGIDYVDLFRTNYPKFRIAWKSLSKTGEELTAAKEAEYYFPFKLPTDGKLLPLALQHLKGRYYCQMLGELIQVGDDLVELKSVFEETSDYKIPVIEYSKVTPRQVHEVFHLYNRQGKQLNPEEIRNAIYHEVDLTRALLVTAGDVQGDLPWRGVADFLEPTWNSLEQVGHTLVGHGFGTARYRRTKVLSWITALIAFDPIVGGSVRGLSTTKLIDSLLERIQDNDNDELRNHEAIRSLLAVVAGAIAAHAGTDAWAGKFKDGAEGNKWLELGLVGSITGVALAAFVHDDFKQRLKDNQDAFLKLSASDLWNRPENAQSGNQYEYIARVARETAELLGADEEQVEKALSDLIGASGTKAIWTVPLKKKASTSS